MTDPWVALALEGNFDLISKLHRAVDGEAGFGTVVIDRKGFSPNDDTHNLVLDYLRERGVNVLDGEYEIGNLEVSLRKGRPACLNNG